MSWAEFVQHIQDTYRKAKAAFDPDKVKIGDVITFWHNPYQHNTSVRITKINRKSWKGVEIPTSYGAGKEWSIHKEAEGLMMRGADRCDPEKVREAMKDVPIPDIKDLPIIR